MIMMMMMMMMTSYMQVIIIIIYSLRFVYLQERVNQTNVTGNLDHPEGALSAILQAIACQVNPILF
jgi:hypothetical protein